MRITQTLLIILSFAFVLSDGQASTSFWLDKSDSYVCGMATKIDPESGKRIWVENQVNGEVSEARGRGVDCLSYRGTLRLFKSKLPDCFGGPVYFFGKGNTKHKHHDKWANCVGTVIIAGRGEDDPNSGARYTSEFRNIKGFSIRQGLGSEEYRDGRKLVGRYNMNVHEGKWLDLAIAENRHPKAKNPVAAQKQSNELLPVSSGSGFAVSKSGYVVTNNHIIEGCGKVLLHHQGGRYNTSVIYSDSQNDLALLKTELKPDAVIALAATKPQLAQDIFVSGYPFGLSISSSVKVTKGIVSSLIGIGNNLAQLQIDAAIQSGNSGGPILDEFGNLIGVAVAKLDMKYALENFGDLPENTNFGVKAEIVEALLDANGVKYQTRGQTKPSPSEFSDLLSKGTFFISCWMTMTQKNAMKTKRVMFTELEADKFLKIGR